MVLPDGLTYRNLDYWTRLGWVNAVNPDPGSGHPRTWDDGELAIAALIVRFRAAGLGLPTAARAARAWHQTERPVQLAPGVELAVSTP